VIPKLRCPRPLIDETLGHLRAGGSANCETVVLWLGIVRDGSAEVREVHRPEQRVDTDFFLIPQEGVRAMMRRLTETRFQILAQVHSHPEAAFHSSTDDACAIIRHVGAVSIVIPYFAVGTDSTTFANRAATYQLDAFDHWIAVDFAAVVEVI